MSICEKRGIIASNFGVDWSTKPRLSQTDDVIGVNFSTTQVHFMEFLEWCTINRITMIQASGDVSVPKDVKIPIIYIPNLSIEVMRLIRTLPAFIKANGGEGMETFLVESHQKTKPAKPSATTLQLAHMLGISEDKIEVVRSEAIQILIGVPLEALEGHAYHFVIIKGKGQVQIFRLHINGRDSYAEGCIWFATALTQATTPQIRGLSTYIPLILPFGVLTLQETLERLQLI
jgi:dihydrodipicolinate reductase